MNATCVPLSPPLQRPLDRRSLMELLHCSLEIAFIKSRSLENAWPCFLVQPYHWQDHSERELNWVIFPVCCLKSLSSAFLETRQE